METEGWLMFAPEEYDGWGAYKMHQVLQEVLRFKLKPNAFSCKDLIATLTNLHQLSLGDNPVNVFRFIPYLECLINGLTDTPLSIVQLINLYSDRLLDTGYFQKALPIAEKNKTTAQQAHLSAMSTYNEKKDPSSRKVLKSTFNQLSCAYSTLALVHNKLENLEELEAYLTKVDEIDRESRHFFDN